MHKNDKLITYRSPIMKGRNRESVHLLLTTATIGLLFLLLCLPIQHWWAILFAESFLLIFPISILLFRSFYVQLNFEQIKICNAVFHYYSKSYRLKEIQKVELGHKGPGFGEFLYMYITTANRRSRRYIINLVNDDDLLALIEELQQRGIFVDTTQLQLYFDLLEQRKRKKAQGEALRRKAREYKEACRREREKRKR